MAGRKPTQRIDELEDEIKHRDRRIEELRCEIDELRDLVRRTEDDVEDAASTLERWWETFDMTETESGAWTWQPFWNEYQQTLDDYNALVRDWNLCLPIINGRAPGSRRSRRQQDQARARTRLALCASPVVMVP